MASLARLLPRDEEAVMTITEDEAWAAFERRDRAWDGRVIGAVKSTGLYCRPSCPARRRLSRRLCLWPGAQGRPGGKGREGG